LGMQMICVRVIISWVGFSYSLFTKCTKDDMRQSSYGELKREKQKGKDKDNKKRDKWGMGNARET